MLFQIVKKRRFTLAFTCWWCLSPTCLRGELFRLISVWKKVARFWLSIGWPGTYPTVSSIVLLPSHWIRFFYRTLRKSRLCSLVGFINWHKCSLPREICNNKLIPHLLTHGLNRAQRPATDRRLTCIRWCWCTFLYRVKVCPRGSIVGGFPITLLYANIIQLQVLVAFATTFS